MIPSDLPSSSSLPSLPPSESDPLLSSLSPLDPESLRTVLDDEAEGALSDIDDLQATRDGQSPSNSAPTLDHTLPLTEAQTQELASRIDSFLTDYAAVMEPRWATEQEIRDAFELLTNAQSQGVMAGSSMMVSGLLRRLVSQVAARINRNFDSVNPSVVISVVKGGDLTQMVSGEEFEKVAQVFFLDYLERQVRVKYLRPLINVRACKLGTCVVRVDWEEWTDREIYWTDEGTTGIQEVERGGVKWKLIPNEHAIIWPVNISDWADAEWAGHRAYLTKSEWRSRARRLDLPDTVIQLVESSGGEPDEKLVGEAARHGVDLEAASSYGDNNATIEIVEIWGNTILPDEDLPTKFQLFYHPPSKTILGPVRINNQFCQSHPYLPIRYDWNDNFCYGTGIGQELLSYWSADMALRNFEMDLIRASFPVILRDAGSMFNTSATNPHPGMQIPVNDTERDFVTRHLGGESPQLPMAIQNNLLEARETTGFAPVLSGLGDPVLKSGGGTGSINSLIDQAGQRIAQIYAYMQDDWSAIYLRTLQLICQFAPDGVYYQYTDRDSADIIRTMKFIPPRGQISDLFRVRAMAPSANTSSEARKQNYLILWKFASESIMVLTQMMGSIAQQNNPAGFQRWQMDSAIFLQEIMKKTIQYHELAGVDDLVPEFGEPTPQDQIMNQMSAALSQAQQQVAALQAQLQQISQPQQGNPPIPPSNMPMPPNQGTGMPMDEQPTAPPYPSA